ncbi:MAG: hypothetical protein HKN25_04870 [Pyrinomonadaceae bacterium]|nr:hypothetical protein [Pyrinomonadaceae bacterium]
MKELTNNPADTSKYEISDTQKKEIENDLREKMGLASIGFDKHETLIYDKREPAIRGSEKMRELILSAIDDQKNVFLVCNYSGANEVQFAKTDKGWIDVNSRITTYEIMFDFEDFENSRRYTPDVVLESYSLGILLFHEIDHKVSYDPKYPIPPTGVRPDKSSRGVRGVIENTNIVRRELSLVLRNSKRRIAKRYRGANQIFTNTRQITFKGPAGKRNFLRWKLESKRPKMQRADATSRVKLGNV